MALGRVLVLQIHTFCWIPFALIMTSSAIDKMFENFEPIFEQNAEVNFGPTFVKNVNFGSIFVKSVNFGLIFEKSVNFEHFVDGR